MFEGRSPVKVQLARLEPSILARVHFASYKAAAAILRTVGDRGFGRAAWTLECIFGSGNAAVFKVFGGRLLRVPLGDGYWMPALIRDRDYEPEVHFVLSKVLNSRCAFLDCGANIGWWSLFASTIISSPRRIIAVEASPGLYERLASTAALNGDPFICLNRALWNIGGERLAVLADQRNHARASVTTLSSTAHRAGPTPVEIQSTTLDELERDFLDATISEVVVKLDVEGAELRALEGGQHLLRRDCLIVYEDHGADPSCHVTREVLQAGFRVFYCDDLFHVQEILNATSLAAFKKDRTRGYNLFACRPATAFHHVMLNI